MPIEKSKMRLREKKERPFLIAVLFGFFFSLLYLAAFLLVASTAAYAVPDPSALLLPLSYAVLVVTAIMSGITIGRFAGRRGALAAFLSGLLFSGFLALVSYTSGNLTETVLPVFCITYLAFSLLAALGGMLGCRKKEKHRKHRHAS